MFRWRWLMKFLASSERFFCLGEVVIVHRGSRYSQPYITSTPVAVSGSFDQHHTKIFPELLQLPLPLTSTNALPDQRYHQRYSPHHLTTSTPQHQQSKWASPSTSPSLTPPPAPTCIVAAAAPETPCASKPTKSHPVPLPLAQHHAPSCLPHQLVPSTPPVEEVPAT